MRVSGKDMVTKVVKLFNSCTGYEATTRKLATWMDTRVWHHVIHLNTSISNPSLLISMHTHTYAHTHTHTHTHTHMRDDYYMSPGLRPPRHNNQIIEPNLYYESRQKSQQISLWGTDDIMHNTLCILYSQSYVIACKEILVHIYSTVFPHSNAGCLFFTRTIGANYKKRKSSRLFAGINFMAFGLLVHQFKKQLSYFHHSGGICANKFDL